MAREIVIQLIEQQMKSKSITAYKLSKLTGVDKGNLSRILSGKNSPTLESLTKVCDALDCELYLKIRDEA